MVEILPSRSDRSLRSLVDLEHGLVSREIYVNEEIYQQELEQVFARAWLFVGHESLVPNPGDYFASRMGEEHVLLVRDRKNKLHVFLNTCRHRGMKVCRYDQGNTVEFMCPYHGWSYGTDGALVGVPFAKDAYGPALDRSRLGLVEVARMENYKGTIWATWDPSAPAFSDYLGGYRLYLDLLLDAWDGREGPHPLADVLRWAVVDRVTLYLAPLLLGGREAPGVVAGAGGELKSAVRLGPLSARLVGPDLLIEADVVREPH